MGDGDEKLVRISADSGSMTITSHDTNQTWIVHANIDLTTCTALVDFHVPGKPNPPPVKNLVATFWKLASPVGDSGSGSKKSNIMLQFTDPSGYFRVPADYPIGAWIMVTKTKEIVV
eukprot:gnl/TRDRNA2_/TRDRNA2_73741_c0_seq1.p1 gnl/TRDRNA2_/TRDRNA2_73741_c0~~gnl/TRDRNA2_/TRDRNA2_73741_c0_seq1.p1  ORF type:complete len:134 (-),score=17.92 gnl/TRDRNA2_/TRDRNA2_73741_c0_seq1:158-508(-)